MQHPHGKPKPKAAPAMPMGGAGGPPGMPPGMAPPMGGAGGAPGAPNPMDMIMAHAMGAMGAVHAAGGMTSVPGPGQTINSGSWLGPTPPATPAPAPLAPTLLPGTSLRQQMGYGTPIKAADGMTKVPGKGAPNVDKVPAVLAPGEAVLNQGAAMHMGRGAIAALNAVGAHHMAMAGVAPPMPGGPPVGRGMPPAKSAGPTKGMPPKGMAGPAKGKMPPPKAKVAVAARGK